MAETERELLEALLAEVRELRRMVEDRGPEELTPKQAADYLGVSPGTLANRRCTGLDPIPYEKKGSRVFYRRSVLDRYRRDHTFLHTTEETTQRSRRKAA